MIFPLHLQKLFLVLLLLFFLTNIGFTQRGKPVPKQTPSTHITGPFSFQYNDLSKTLTITKRTIDADFSRIEKITILDIRTAHIEEIEILNNSSGNELKLEVSPLFKGICRANFYYDNKIVYVTFYKT